MKYSIDKWKVGWIENWFKYQDQVIFISSTKYSWRPLTAGVPQRLIVGPMLFNICINNVSDETEFSFSKFAGGAKLRGMFDTPEGCAAIQKDLNRQENRAKMSLMKFTEGNAKPFTWGGKTPASGWAEG